MKRQKLSKTEQAVAIRLKPRGGSISPLEKHADFLLDLIEKQSDLTLDELHYAVDRRAGIFSVSRHRYHILRKARNTRRFSCNVVYGERGVLRFERRMRRTLRKLALSRRAEGINELACLMLRGP